MRSAPPAGRPAWFLVVLAAGGLAALGFASVGPPPAAALETPAVPEDLVEEFTLENGMRFLVVPRDQSPTVACFIFVGVGSADEPRGRTGMAHLLEHLLFKGTPRLGTADYGAEERILGEIERTMDAMDAERARLAAAAPPGALEDPPPPASPEIERLEAELDRLETEMRRHVIKNEIWGTYDRHGGTIQNAFTSEDMTAYFVVLPANKLEVWAMIESERMSGSVLREFYSERSVVQEERRRSRESTPGGLIGDALIATAFTAHPYRNPVIGWMSDLEDVRRAEVLDFYRTYYQPSNMIAVLVGDVSPEAARRLVEKHFGRLPSEPITRPRRTREPPMTGIRERLVEFDAEPELRLAFRIPDYHHPDFAALDVAATLLGGGRTSRLRKRLILEEQAARNASVWVERALDPWFLQVALQPLAGRTLADIEGMAWEEIERLKGEPPTAEELASVKTRLKADAVYRLESNLRFGLWLGHYALLDGDWREGYRYLERVDGVTPADVRRVAAEYLVARNEIRIELRRPETEAEGEAVKGAAAAAVPARREEGSVR